MSTNGSLLIMGGFAVLLVGAFYLYTESQKKMQPAQPVYYSPPGNANTNQTGYDHTAEDWATGIKAGTEVADTVVSILDHFDFGD